MPRVVASVLLALIGAHALAAQADDPPATAALLCPRLDAILAAVEERNDEFLWQSLSNLSSGYLLDRWDTEPLRVLLLKLDVPIAIFHGGLDGSTRVEGVRETAAAFEAAGLVGTR